MAIKARKQHTARPVRRDKAMVEAMAAFPDRFRVVREHFGLSDAEMARRLNISLAAWRCWERGKRKGVSIGMFARIGQEFGVSIDWLCDGCRPLGGIETRNDNIPIAPSGKPIPPNHLAGGA